MINSKASNWVDRDEPPEGTLIRVLASYLDRDPASKQPELEEYARTVRGMADADATEIHIAGYLRTLEARHRPEEHPARHRRAVAIALWHIAKSAEVRDRALRLLAEFGPKHTSDEVPLSTWLAERLLPDTPGQEPEA